MELQPKIPPNNIEKAQNSDSSFTFNRMREILVDWLVEVAEEYKLVSDTIYLTISYIDRYLSSHAVDRNKLQLLGVCCMLIASYLLRTYLFYLAKFMVFLLLLWFGAAESMKKLVLHMLKISVT